MFRQSTDDEELKDALYDDDLFVEYVETHGLHIALEEVTRFHRTIANQLIVNAVDEYVPGSGWVGRTMRLCHRAKRRRNELRRVLRASAGEAVAGVVIEQLGLRFPRAVWGSAVSND